MFMYNINIHKQLVKLYTYISSNTKMALQRGQPLPICRGNGNGYRALPLVLTKPGNIFLSAVASCSGAAVPVAFSPTSILSMRSAVGPVLAPPSASAPWFASLDVNALPSECILRHSTFLRQEPLWRKYRGHSNVHKPTRDSIMNEFSTKWQSVSSKNMKHLHLLNACLATDPCPLPNLQSLGQDWTHCLQQLANVLSKKASFAGLECSIPFQSFYIIWLATHPLKISVEHLWTSLNFKHL